MRSSILYVTLTAFALLGTPDFAYASYGKQGPATVSVILWAIALSAAFAVYGRYDLNRISAFLLGAVGGTIGAGIWHNLTGTAIGFVIGGVVAIGPPYRRKASDTPADA